MALAPSCVWQAHPLVVSSEIMASGHQAECCGLSLSVLVKDVIMLRSIAIVFLLLCLLKTCCVVHMSLCRDSIIGIS